MKTHTSYMTFNTTRRRELIRITEEVQAAVDEAGIAEGMVLISAMHITAGVWVNDDELGLHEDVLEWLDMKNLLVHHQAIVPVTAGRLDLGPWQQIFYCEFDGGRSKRLVIKAMGE